MGLFHTKIYTWIIICAYKYCISNVVLYKSFRFWIIFQKHFDGTMRLSFSKIVGIYRSTCCTKLTIYNHVYLNEWNVFSRFVGDKIDASVFNTRKLYYKCEWMKLAYIKHSLTSQQNFLSIYENKLYLSIICCLKPQIWWRQQYDMNCITNKTVNQNGINRISLPSFNRGITKSVVDLVYFQIYT